MVSKHWKYNISFVFAIQLLSLFIMGIVEFFIMTKGYPLPISLNLITNGGIALSLLALWAITLWKTPRSFLHRDVILGVLMVLWFLIVEMNRRINYIPLQSMTILFAVYLIALPFASITQDQDRQIGIRLVSGFYIAGSLLFMALALILLLGGTFSGLLEGKVYWDGARLLVISHPNITSRIFMIALALCVGFFWDSKKIWVKVLFFVAAALLFAGTALTNTRAVIIVVCVILAGNVFFGVYQNNWNRFLIGVIAAIVAVVVFYISSTAIFEWNIARLISQPTMDVVQEQTSSDYEIQAFASDILSSGETAIVSEQIPLKDRPEGNSNSGQQSFLSDLPTLNNRTIIWSAFIFKIRDNPGILLHGTIDSRLVRNNLHTHNAWLEALIMLGLPGLLLVIVFSWNATWSSLRLLWSSSVGMFQKNIALLTLATMVAALLEPCLFITYTEWNFSDFFFFLCLGYLTLWNKQIPRKK